MPRPKKTAAKASAPAEKELTVEAVVVTEDVESKSAVKKSTARKPAVKKETASKKTAFESKVVIQANGSEAIADDLVEKAIAASEVKTVKKVDIYVKPEVNKVYYVINGDTFGDFDLF